MHPHGFMWDPELGQGADDGRRAGSGCLRKDEGHGAPPWKGVPGFIRVTATDLTTPRGQFRSARVTGGADPMGPEVRRAPHAARRTQKEETSPHPGGCAGASGPPKRPPRVDGDVLNDYPDAESRRSFRSRVHGACACPPPSSRTTSSSLRTYCRRPLRRAPSRTPRLLQPRVARRAARPWQASRRS